jgi:hypothetical protein
MPLNVTYPSSVNVGFFISLGWNNTFYDEYFTVSRQINNRLTWQGTVFPIGSNLTRYSEIAEETWSNVRYRIIGFPSGTEVITNWITVVGGSGPGDPDPGDPDPEPPLSVPIILVPESVTPNVSFQINWSDSSITAVYDIEESVNRGNYQRIATDWPHKSYSRTPSSSWNTVQYIVRAKRNGEETVWAHSAEITVGTIFTPKMNVKIGSTVRTAKDGWVKINGTLRKIIEIWVKVDGQLKKS